MIFHKHIPKLPLAQYVDSIMYIEGNNKGIGFPKIAMSLIFNLNDKFKLFTDSNFVDFIDYKKYWVAGLQTQPTYVESYGESKMIVIQFKTIGAYAFLHQPLWHFTDDYTALDCVFNQEAEDIWEQLQEAKTIHEKFVLTENFLCSKLSAIPIPQEKLISSVDNLFKKSTTTPINQICQQHRISRKHLNFLFQEYLGVSPKMLSSLHRFQSMLHTIRNAKPDKLTDVAYQLDFFDQAHFNKNFKRFTGLKPQDYVKQVAITPSLKIVPHFLPIA